MQLFNHTRKLFNNGEVSIAALKVMLVSASYTFAASQTAMTAATAAEVSGNGWAAGGPTIASAAVTIANVNEAKLDGTDISVTATGGDIGPAAGFVVYDSTGGWPLFYNPFLDAEDGPITQTAGVGTPFNINWDEDGIYVDGPLP